MSASEAARKRGRPTSSRGSSNGLRAAISRRLSRSSVLDSPEHSRGSQVHLAESGKLIEDLNSQTAIFRDLLIGVGKTQDSPELRDKIRQVRRKCIDTCMAASQSLLPQIRSDVAEGIPVDSQHLVNLVCCTQLLLRELHKCKHLHASNPMDMTEFYESKPGTSGMAVLDMLVLWRPVHDYHKEELTSIGRDIETVKTTLGEMQEFMPQESNCKTLIEDNFVKWRKRRNRGLYRHFSDLCCLCRSDITS